MGIGSALSEGPLAWGPASAPPSPLCSLNLELCNCFPSTEVPGCGALSRENEEFLAGGGVGWGVSLVPLLGNTPAFQQRAHPLSLEPLNLLATKTLSCLSLFLEAKRPMVLFQSFQFLN